MDTKQPAVYASLLITLFFASVTVVLRLVARRLTQQRLSYDDHLCLIAYTAALGWAVIILIWADRGLGLHTEDIDGTHEQIVHDSTILLYSCELVYAFSLAFAKMTILAFYWRMFKTSTIRIPIIALAVSTWIWLIIRTFMAIFHCVPVARFWDKSIPGRCDINDSNFFFGTVLVHLVLDILIIALPILQIRTLQLRTSQKIGVSARGGER